MRDNLRFWIAAAIALFSLFGYLGTKQFNPVTGETQHVRLSEQDEIALGLQAAPRMAAEYGGLARDPQGDRIVQSVGTRLVQRTAAARTPYAFKFHLLADPKTINAFALPGGQVFITEGLLRRLRSEGEVAGVLGHEIGHVVGRHGAEHLAKAQLIQGLGGAAVIAGSDPDHPERSYRNQAIAAAVTQLISMRFGRDDELESDRLGVRFLRDAGYDPRAMIGVMEVLQKAAQGSGRPPEFFSTHPNPEHRIQAIQEAIRQLPASGT